MIAVNVGRLLWDFTYNVVEAMADVQDFLLTPFEIPNITILGFELFEGFEFTPLLISGGVIILILGFGIIKAVNPV
jgi:hypothetical protein